MGGVGFRFLCRTADTAQYRKNLGGVQIVQRYHPRRAGGIDGPVQLCDQTFHAFAGRRIAAQQNTVAAIVTDDREVVLLTGAQQGSDQPGDLVGAGMIELDHIDIEIAAAIDAPHQIQQAFHIGGVVGDDEGVVVREGLDMTAGGNQRLDQFPQGTGGDVLGPVDIDDLLAAGDLAIVGQDVTRGGLAHGGGEDAQHAAVFHRSITIDIQGGEKNLVGLIDGHGLVGQHGHFAFHPRIDHDLLVGFLRDPLNHRTDLGVAHVDGQLLAAAFSVIGLGQGAVDRRYSHQ